MRGSRPSACAGGEGLGLAPLHTALSHQPNFPSLAPPLHATAQVLTIVAVELKYVTAEPGAKAAFKQALEAIALSACIDPKTLKVAVEVVGEERLQLERPLVKELLEALSSEEGGGVSAEVRRWNGRKVWKGRTGA